MWQSSNSSQYEQHMQSISSDLQQKMYSGVWTYQAEKWLFEVHIFDCALDLYGQTISIFPYHYIRANQKFDNIEQLTQQIHHDSTVAKNTTTTVMTFGTFDKTHPGHARYLRHARMIWTQLITVIARDTTVANIKSRTSHFDEQTRIQHIQALDIPDHQVVLWHPKNPLYWPRFYTPETYVLWYDQQHFISLLQKEIETTHQGQIIRLWSFLDTKYKSSKM